MGASPLSRIKPIRVPLEVSLKLNGKFLGTISVAVDAKGDGEIDARRLMSLLGPVVDAKVIAALNGKIAGRPKVDFVDLDVGTFSVRFDSLALEVVGKLAFDSAVPASVRFTEQPQIPVPAQFDQPNFFSAGVNIGASQRYVYGDKGGFEPVRATFDVVSNIGGFGGVTFTGGATYDGENWERRELRLTHDMFEQAIRATLGEFTPSSASLQGSGRILGIGIERAYSTIRPFQNTRPIGRQQFTLEHDSSVDVFVNQIRVQVIRLAAGRYDIGDFPFAAGPNQIKLVVEDIGGRREILDFDVFNTTSLLTPGMTEFGGAIGVRDKGRLQYGFSPAATGYAYHGVSDTMTFGINGQATSRAAQVGGVAVLGTPLGFFQFESAASRAFSGGGSGLATSLDYRGDFSIRRKADFRVNASALYRSAAFQDAFARSTQNFQVLQTAVQVQWQVPLDISVGLGAAYTKARFGGSDSYRYDVSLGRSFGRIGVNFTGSRVDYRVGRPSETRVGIGLSLRLSQRDNVDARYDSGTGRKEIEISRTPEGRLGELSGALRYTQERNETAISGRLGYVNNRFDLVVNHNRIERAGPDGGISNASDWNVRSFIGYAGGGFGIGRAVDDAFIIAPVHRTLHGAQASILSGDRVVARSGLFGPALIPIGRAYGVNRFDVKVDPLPVGYDLGAGAINTFPGYGTGYRLMIGSDDSHIVVGFLVTAAGPVSLASGTIEPVDAARRKTWKERGFFTNRTGRFVADHLAPGRYRLLLAGLKPAEIEIKTGTEGMTDVGTINVAP